MEERKSGRLLIIDEAEQLPYEALELLRRLCKMISRAQALAHKNKCAVTEDIVNRAARLVKVEVMK